jgi:hypothetical protein
MGVSMMTRMKELREESRRIRLMVFYERLKSGIVTEALVINCDSISPTLDGRVGSRKRAVPLTRASDSLKNQRDFRSQSNKRLCRERVG